MRYSLQKLNKRQLGYTIVELSVTVSIAAVFFLGSMSLISKVIDTWRVSETIVGLPRTIVKIESMWHGAGSYSDLSISTAGGAGAFESSDLVRDAGGAIVSANSKFKQPVTLSLNPDLPTTGSNRGYVIVYTGIPTAVCAEVAIAAATTSGVKGLLLIPETLVGVTPGGAVTTLGLDASAHLTGAPADGVVVFESASPTVNITNLAGVGGCGTAKPSVSLVLVNWK